MLRKTVLALSAVASLGVGSIVATTPAEAGYWYHGAYVEREGGWQRYHCHWEFRVREYWHHGHLNRIRERVRVCD